MRQFFSAMVYLYIFKDLLRKICRMISWYDDALLLPKPTQRIKGYGFPSGSALVNEMGRETGRRGVVRARGHAATTSSGSIPEKLAMEQVPANDFGGCLTFPHE